MSSWDFGRYGNYGIEGYNACKHPKYRTGRNLTRTFPKIVPKGVLQNLPTMEIVRVRSQFRVLLVSARSENNLLEESGQHEAGIILYWAIISMVYKIISKYNFQAIFEQ